MVIPPQFVADTSFTLSWVFDDESNPLGNAVWEALRNDATVIHVPSLWMWEFTNGLLHGEKRGRISIDAIEQCLAVLSEAQIRIIPELPALVFSELPGYMRTHELTSYDAAYLALAARSGLPLATLDGGLAKAARIENVELLV